MARKPKRKAAQKVPRKAAPKAEHPLKDKLTKENRRKWNAMKKVVGDNYASMAIVDFFVKDLVAADRNAADIAVLLEPLIEARKPIFRSDRFVIIRGRGRAIVIRFPTRLPAANRLHQIGYDQLSQLDALQAAVGEDIGTKVFGKLLAREQPSIPYETALLIASALDPLIKAGKLRIRRGGYLTMRLDDRVVVEPYQHVFDMVKRI